MEGINRISLYTVMPTYDRHIVPNIVIQYSRPMLEQQRAPAKSCALRFPSFQVLMRPLLLLCLLGMAPGASASFVKKTSGSCGAGLIRTKEGCEAAARALGYSDTSAYTFSSTYEPPGCSYCCGGYSSPDLLFNTNMASTYSCDSTARECLCCPGCPCWPGHHHQLNKPSTPYPSILKLSTLLFLHSHPLES